MRSKEVFGWFLVGSLVVTPVALWLAAARHAPQRTLASPDLQAPQKKPWGVTYVPSSHLEWRRMSRTVPSYYATPTQKVTRPKQIKYWEAFAPGDPLLTESDPVKAQAIGAEQVLQDEREKLLEYPERGLGCGHGMVRVTGGMLDWQVVMAKQDQACKDPNWNSQYLCVEYDPNKLNYGTKTSRKPIDVCMDRYEFPNLPGQYPAVMVTWLDARSVCEASGKRLCTEDEWVYACEGEDAEPYPYGYARDGTACNIDRVIKGVAPNEAALGRPDSDAARDNLAQVFAGVPSGSMPGCVSSTGVYDLTGNVDEWTVWAPGGRPRDGNLPSILKGGYWGPVRTRCQPSTSSHGPEFFFYQQGFRCCSDPTPAS